MTHRAINLHRGALVLGAVSLGGYLVDYAFNLGLTRFLSPHDYGDFKLAHAFASFFGLAVLLGGDRAAPMVLSPLIEKGASHRAFEYLRFYLRNALVLSLVLMAATWSLSFLHVGTKDPSHHHPLAWVVVAVPINAAGALASRTLQSAHLPLLAVVPWRIGFPLLQLGIFVAVVRLWGSLTVAEAIAVAIVASAVVTLWQWFRVHRRKLVVPRRDPAFQKSQAWLAASLPMMGSFLVALALNQSDLYFLELLGDEAEVGHYAAASMAAHFLPLIQVTVVGLLAPVARPALDAGARASAEVYRQGLGIMLAALIPVGVVLAVFGQWILGHFGPEYRVGHGVLQFLVLGNFAWATAALSSLWLQYRGLAGSVLMVSIVTLALDSALNLVLIPRYGMTGAAGGTALTLTLAAVAVLVLHARTDAPAGDA